MPRSSESSSLIGAVDRLAGARVGVVGDLVADVYVSGLTERVSREAPVLIVRHEQEWLRPGGAANVAANIAALGATACLVGMIGDDEVGGRLLEHLGESPDGSVECSAVVRATGRATISKTRFLAGARLTHRQQVLRLDRQPNEPPTDAMIESLRCRVTDLNGRVDAWVASDYGYGSFNEALRKLLREMARSKPVLADSRWELPAFDGLTLLKPNEEEARAAASALGFCSGDEGHLASELALRLHAKSVLVTLGNKGMALSSEGVTTRLAAVGTEEIVDLTGAGDSVAATLAAGIAAGLDPVTAARLANHAGSIVVMKEGAATASLAELKQSIEREHVTDHH